MIKVGVWIIGEFCAHLPADVRANTPDVLCRLMNFGYDDELTKGWIITALMKIQQHTDTVKTCISKYTASRNTDIQ
jgi:hypothetical protein